MRFDSMLYTIGTALNAAHESGTRVAVLATGHWMSGTIGAVDGYGVMLDDNGTDQYIIKLDQITAVRVIAEAGEAGEAEQSGADSNVDEDPVYGPRHIDGISAKRAKPELRLLS